MKAADKPTSADLEFHKGSIANLTGDPLYLMMNSHSSAAKDKKKIPLFLFETSKPDGQFKEIDFTMASSDAEQVAVNDFAQATDSD